MSHVAEVELFVKDLQALKAACQALGLEFRENQRRFRWYGAVVGNTPLPAGLALEDLGQCEHAIAVRGNTNAYEIGVARRRDGKPGYALLWDSWNGGFGLEAAVGREACRLRQEYAVQVGTRQLQSQGYRVRRTISSDGRIRLLASK